MLELKNEKNRNPTLTQLERESAKHYGAHRWDGSLLTVASHRTQQYAELH